MDSSCRWEQLLPLPKWLFPTSEGIPPSMLRFSFFLPLSFWSLFLYSAQKKRTITSTSSTAVKTVPSHLRVTWLGGLVEVISKIFLMSFAKWLHWRFYRLSLPLNREPPSFTVGHSKVPKIEHSSDLVTVRLTDLRFSFGSERPEFLVSCLKHCWWRWSFLLPTVYLKFFSLSVSLQQV